MKRRARALAVATPAPFRRLAMFVLVLAFALQAYAVQTHIHPQLAAAATAVVAHDSGKPLPADPLDPNLCKLCREIVHVGAAVLPGAPQLLLLLDWVATSVPPAQLPATAIAPETGWQSRAPPAH